MKKGVEPELIEIYLNRNHVYEMELARLKKADISPKDYSWYLDLKRYGSVPHAGFDFGIERLVRRICNPEHIRDKIPFPRTRIRTYP